MTLNNFAAKYGLLLLFNLLGAVLLCAMVLAGSVGINGLLEALGYLFGGIPSLIDLVILGLVALGFVAVFLLARMDMNAVATALSVVLALIAAVYGLGWFDLPDGRIWWIVGLLLFTLVETAVVAGVGATRAMFASPRRSPSRTRAATT